ncbi:hypothetical protein D920_00230, partial [Enterococcus faecalis 13-SD-W-01]
ILFSLYKNSSVDARVNNKEEIFETLHGRLTAHENLSDEEIDKLTVDLSNQKGQVGQLNDIIARLYSANGMNYEIYVSADSVNYQE